jgi:cytochrome c peroxidase
MPSRASIYIREGLSLSALMALSLLGFTGAKAASNDSSPQTELAALGRLIFFDANLSASGKMSCGTCHGRRYAYGPPPGRAIAMGGPDMKLSGTRAVPSIRYLRGNPPFGEEHHFADGDVGPVGGFMWDGRANSIREQASLPLLAANEMANGSAAEIAAKLRKSAYAGELQRIFGRDVFLDPQRALEAASAALDAFQQTPSEFFPYSSRYDAFLRGEVELDEHEERGVEIFKDPARGNCASCHLGTIRAGTPPAFNDYDYANVGVPRNPRIPANADPEYYDAGLSGPIRKDLRDRKEYCGLFRAPTLRNVAVRDAFFHNGVFGSLQEVMAFYVERDLHPEKYYSRRADGTLHKFDDLPPGCPDNVDHDPPLDRKPGAAPALTQEEQDDVIAFLKTLTDSDVVQ